MVFSSVRGPALRRHLCLLRSHGGSSTLSATCRALRPWLMICPTASPPGHIKVETRSGGAYVAHRNKLKANDDYKNRRGHSRPHRATAPWRWWRTLRPRPLAGARSRGLAATKPPAAVQACRRRSAAEYIQAIVTALAHPCP
jgi:hypothetical protein